MPKSNRITPVDVRTINNVAIGSKEVVDNDQTKILKIVCIGVVISTVASTATFAAIISNQANRIENIERAFEHTQIKDRLVKLESVADTYKTILSHRQAPTKYLEDRMEKIANQTASVEATMIAENKSLKLQMTKLEESNERLAKQYESLTALNGSVMQLNFDLANENTNSSQIRDARLSHIEENINSFEVAIQELVSYNIELESNKTVYRAQIESRLLQIELDTETYQTKLNNNSDRIIDLEAYMTQQIDQFKTLSSNLTDLAICLWAINTTTRNALEGVIENNDRISLINESLITVSNTSKALYLNLASMKTKIDTIDAAVQNNYDERIKHLVQMFDWFKCH